MANRNFAPILLFVAFSIFAAASVPAYQGPQTCGLSTGHTTAEVCSTATHTSQTSDTDKRKAEQAASEGLLVTLAANSGVACGTCTIVDPETGSASEAQCAATVTYGSGTMSVTYTEVNPGGTTSQQGWTVKVCWTGTYRVLCSSCD